MSIIRAFTGAISSTFADQWKEIITAVPFDETTVVSPGVLKQTSNAQGTNYYGSRGVITTGSKIYVPENTAAFVFDRAGIEEIITESGGYEYLHGQKSVFNGDSVQDSLFAQIKERIGYGGQTPDEKHIAFVNLREIRGIKFGTRGPMAYHDRSYEVDLEITAFGSFSVRICDPIKFVRGFLPPNTSHHSFRDAHSRRQLTAELLQSFTAALNSLSASHRISELPSQAHAITSEIAHGHGAVGSWPERFGIELVNVSIENIEFTDESWQIAKDFSTKFLGLKAYENISQKSSDAAAQQKIARGIEKHGLGESAGMVFGLNLAHGLNPQTGSASPQPTGLSLDAQVEAVRKFKELLDEGLITEEEFAIKRREIMGM